MVVISIFSVASGTERFSNLTELMVSPQFLVHPNSKGIAVQNTVLFSLVKDNSSLIEIILRIPTSYIVKHFPDFMLREYRIASFE